jgi:hypothetical protein
LPQVAPACNIFARASPENKLRIVRALQRAAPAAAAAALAKAVEAGGNGKSLPAISRDLVTKSQELGRTSTGLGKNSRGIATTSGTTSPDVVVDLATTSYGSSINPDDRNLR